MPIGLETPTEETATGVTEESPTSEETTVDESTEAAEHEESPTSEEVPAEDTEQPGAEPAAEKVRPVVKKGGKTAEDRIRELVAEREYFKGLAEGRTRQDKPAEQPVVEQPKADAAPVRPKAEDFEDPNAYWEAHTKWTIEQAKYEIRKDAEARDAERQQRTAQTEQQRVVQEAFAAHDARMKKAMETDPGLEDIVSDASLKVSDPMTAVIVNVEEGPRLIRWLHEHPEDADRIYALAPTVVLPDGRHVQKPGNPFKVAMEMGKIIERLSHETVKPKKVSNAPPPHKTVGGKGSSSEEDLSELAATDPDAYLAKVREAG